MMIAQSRQSRNAFDAALESAQPPIFPQLGGCAMLGGTRRGFATALLVAGMAAAMPVSAAGSAGDVGDAWIKAVTASDIEAVMKLYAENAVAWFPDEPEHQGAAAIRASYKDMFDHFKINSATLTNRHSEGDGKHESHWGNFSLSVTQKSDGKAMTWTGRYTDVTEQNKGHWMYVVDHASSDPPPPPTAK
jgi:ketosteroid isomerase-like protein